MNPDEATKEYDVAFQKIQGLTWLPWVGQAFSKRPAQARLLVVGESHYYNGESPEERQANREKWLVYPQYTRDVVSESLINNEWSTRTLNTIPRLLFKTTEIDRPRLWADSAYYNIVQRMMDYKQDGSPERPTWEDYVQGWKVFAEVLNNIKPSHCLFIGVSAANSFNHWITTQNIFSGKVVLTQNIGGTWARAGSIEISGNSTELIFVKHLGLPLSSIKWHDYLQAQHPAFMSWLGAEDYAKSRITEQI